jgi:hypothetical protein
VLRQGIEALDDRRNARFGTAFHAYLHFGTRFNLRGEIAVNVRLY